VRQVARDEADGTSLEAGRGEEEGMALKIHHDETRRRFAADVDRGEAVLDYETLDGDTLDLRRTFVSEELRGEGVAGQVVRYALDWARRHDKKIVATCPYVKRFVERHPEYAALEVRPTAAGGA
jgi:predicted GNAT family acetyltransferase